MLEGWKCFASVTVRWVMSAPSAVRGGGTTGSRPVASRVALIPAISPLAVDST